MPDAVSQPNVELLHNAWTYPPDRPSRYSAPDNALVMAGDRLLGISDKLILYAIDIYTGEELQTKTPGGGFPYKSATVMSVAPAVASGGVFFVENDRIKALQLADGSVRPGWNPPTLLNSEAQALLGLDGRLVAVRQDKQGTHFTAYDTFDGSIVWPKKSPDEKAPDTDVASSDFTSGSVSCSSDALFFVANNQLFAINSDFGDRRFPPLKKAAPPHPTWVLNQDLAPLIGEDVVVCSGDGVYGLCRKTGAVLWSVLPDGSNQTKWISALSADRKWVAAVRSDGSVKVLDTTKGDLICETTLPVGGAPVIAGSSIYIVTPDNALLNKVHVRLDKKTISHVTEFSLGEDVADAGSTLGNGTIFIPTNPGRIVAKTFSGVEAACFGGKANIKIPLDAGQFDVGTDFTIEAWVRSTSGGEILSGYPAAADGHGFRFNLGPCGEIRYAALSGDGANQDLARTRATGAADGFWHHVAVSRKGSGIMFYLDGIALPASTLHIRNGVQVHGNGNALHPEDHSPVLNTPAAAPPPAPCIIAPPKGLTIGACFDGKELDDHFAGLLREVRMWDVGLDAPALNSRMGRTLPQTVAHLRGNWHLNENTPADIRNDVVGHELHGTFENSRFVPTDLELDDSAFPYILHQPDLQWPYASSWIVRGQDPIQSTPAISSDGVVCFATNNDLYAVRKSDGARLWSMPFAVACSAPIASGHAFLAMTEGRSLIRIDSHSGESDEVDGFRELGAADTPTAFPTPATDGRFIAAATQFGEVWTLDTLATDLSAGPKHIAFRVGANPSDLLLESGVVYTVAGAGEQRQLYALNCTTGTMAATPVGSTAFCAYGDRVFFIHNDALMMSTPTFDKVRATAAAVTGSHVTGLSADPDANLLVVSTNQGELLGLSFATLGLVWRQATPDGPAISAAGNRAAPGFLNTALVDGRNVYCTSRSGAVVVLDGRNGEFRGLFLVPNAVVTPPVEDAGVVYFGCDNAADQSMTLDGGLHTVIFGDTYALRLGMTPLDQTTLDGKAVTGYAKIASPKAEHVLYYRNPQQCCVEAWVNTQKGGEVVSVCPGADPTKGNVIPGMRLWLDRSDGVHFQITDRPDGQASWETVKAQASTPTLFDGKWHHVAVSSHGPNDIRIYLDNHLQNADPLQRDSTPPAATTDGLLAYLGADATKKDSDPDNFFHGLIGEVRLWDTFLVASEISERMHDKLRGDEPDLLAYWNFDTVGVHDASRNQRDGVLVGPGATFWITDLPFQYPNYPYFTSKASVKHAGEEGASDSKKETTYELTVGVHQADGAAMVNQHVQFWYVRHADIGEPESITLTQGSSDIPLTGIAPGKPESATAGTVWEGRTNRFGEITVLVSTTDHHHGPAFDVHADFMPANERYHLNVLLENQKLTQPTPPKLYAQSRLIQDYHWSTGSQINSDRGRPVYRTTLITRDNDNSPLTHERVELYCTGHMTVEVAGKPYALTPENGQHFFTDAEGELTVVVDAVDLKPESLSVWAGFMNPQQRVTVNPAEDAHTRLANVKAEEMTKPRMKKWKPASEGGPEHGPLLAPEQHPQSEKIAGAVRHVMSVGGPPAAESAPRPVNPVRPAPMNAGAFDLGESFTVETATVNPAASATKPTRAPFADMKQRVGAPMGDQIKPLHTLKHINRTAPITPESVLASMHQNAPGALGFEFVMTKNGVELNYLMTHQHVTDAMGVPTPRPTVQNVHLGSAARAVWDTVRDAGESIAHAAQRIAVKIGEYVQVAIEKANQLIHVVVRSIKQAIDIVVEFFKNLALKLWMIIQFLLLLFDFGDIIEIHKILGDTFRNLGTFVSRTIGDGALVREGFTQLLKVLHIQPEVFNRLSDVSTSAQATHEIHGSPPSPMLERCRSVGARSMYSRAKENQQDARVIGEVQPMGGPVTLTVSATASEEFLLEILQLLPSLVTMSAGDAAQALLERVKKLPGGAPAAACHSVEEALKTIAGRIEEHVRMFDAEIDIPLISTLYEWITGRSLTILNLLCLVLAVIIHVAYVVMTGRKFTDDAQGLPNALLTAHRKRPVPHGGTRSFANDVAFGGAAPDSLGASLPPPIDNPLDYGQTDNAGMECCYLALRSLNIAAVGAADAMFAATVPTVPPSMPPRDIAKAIRGLLGMTASTIMFLYSTPDYVGRRLAEYRERGIEPHFLDADFALPGFYRGWHITMFCFSLLGDAVAFVNGVKAYRSPSAGGDDADVQAGLMALSVGIILDIVYRAYEGGEQYGSDVSESFRTGSRLLLARDQLNFLAKIPGFLFTRAAAGGKSKAFYKKVVWFRLFTQEAALLCHFAAEFGYLGK
jgi:outer membrane protein assembly factor BamB